MKNYEQTKGWMLLWVIVFMGIMAVCISILDMIGNAYGQTATVQAQWTYGGEPDIAEFHLFYGETSGTYAIGYTLPLAGYSPPPAWMTLPIPLEPGNYYFAVKAADGAGNESGFSNEAELTILDVVSPGPCQGLIMRVPVP